MNNVAIITPIYKNSLFEIEEFSILHSIRILNLYTHIFIHPRNLDLDYYINKFPNSLFLSFDDKYFKSHQSYNQLCYEALFYETFHMNFNFILILQTDAIVISNKLDHWMNSGYDFIGAPESTLYRYDISSIKKYGDINFLMPVQFYGCNGGLSLRRISSMINALNNHSELSSFFRNYHIGIGEDVFFSLISKISDDLKIPNEFISAKFAYTNNFISWNSFNNPSIPMGFHAWYKTIEDFNFVKQNFLS